ncbi:MAG: dTDP-glucose 4,6-dehydratase [Anaerocolumna sp.]|nr:dTDP-glucose 4,6-dehydratase [Anaerocolumna sp.]
MKTYLITGGAGFIGTNLIYHLLETYADDVQIINLDLLTYAGRIENLNEAEKYNNYTFIQGDIGDKTLVKTIFETYDIDYVIHLAACSHVDNSIETPEIFFKTNVLGTLNLLEVARTYWEKVDDYKDNKRFLYVSTDEVYGEVTLEPFTENTSLNPRNPYSVSKTSGDLLTKAYYDTYELPVLRTRCSNNYGPYQNVEKLIPRFIRSIFEGVNLPVYGKGLAIRDWLYVSDHCRALDLVVQKGRVGEVYNVGGHNEKNTNEIANILLETIKIEYPLFEVESEITFVTDRKGHDMHYAINPDKISLELGWEAKTTFDRGLSKTVQWYHTNKDFLDN